MPTNQLILAKSYTLEQTRLRGELFNENRKPNDITLFIKVIEKAKNIFATKYHGHFLVSLWKMSYDKDYDEILSQLRRHGLDVITTEDIFKGESLQDKYLIEQDGHPNKFANQKVAEFLLGKCRALPGFAASPH
jgi:hypothetical protein